MPVAEIEPVVRRQIEESAPEFLCQDDTAVHAHITLLGPFADVSIIDRHLLDELRALFATVRRFGFSLRGPLDWRGRLAYLEPQPAEPFRDITRTLCARYPWYPPYSGAYDGLSPHLTLGGLTAGQTVESFTRELAGGLPDRLMASEAQLHWYQPNESRVLARFPFR